MSPKRSEVVVRRHFSASSAALFAAFAEPSLVSRWLSPAPEVRLTLLHFDFREGGSYRFAYDVPDGRRMIVGGVYRTIAAPERIVFSWLIEAPDEHAGIESEVSVTITPTERGTELVIRHANFGRADAEARHADGWQGALVRLAALLAGQQSGKPDTGDAHD